MEKAGRFLILPGDLERQNKRARILSLSLQEFSDKLGSITNDARTLQTLFIRFVETKDLFAVHPVYSSNFPAANAAVAPDNRFAEAFYKFEGIAPNSWIFFFFLPLPTAAEPQAHNR